MPISNYTMVRYSEISQTVEYDVITYRQHKDDVIQIPISRDPEVGHKVCDLKKAIAAALCHETDVFDGLSGCDFERFAVCDLMMHGHAVQTLLAYCPCPDRAVQPGSAYVVAIKLNDGSAYSAGMLNDSGDECNLPTPMAPRKSSDEANHDVDSRKRQRCMMQRRLHNRVVISYRQYRVHQGPATSGTALRTRYADVTLAGQDLLRY